MVSLTFAILSHAVEEEANEEAQEETSKDEAEIKVVSQG